MTKSKYHKQRICNRCLENVADDWRLCRRCGNILKSPSRYVVDLLKSLFKRSKNDRVPKDARPEVRATEYHARK